MALYPMLVARQRRDVLDKLFRAVRVACRFVREDLWDEIVRDFMVAHSPRHWEPNHFGEPMRAYLAARRKEDPTLPSYLEELADYAWIRFKVAVANVDEEDDGVGLDRTLFVRHYGHDVPSFVTASGRENVELPEGPVATPCTLIVCWSRTKHRVVVVTATPAALVVIGRRIGRDPNEGGAVSEAAIWSAERELVDGGLLSERG